MSPAVVKRKSKRRNKRGQKGLPRLLTKTIVGTFSANARGYGFVVASPEQAAENNILKDIFIPPDKVNGALHSDIVECAIDARSSGKSRHSNTRPEGAITRILERGYPQLAGTFFAEAGRGGYLTTLEPKIPYAFPVAAVAVKKLGLIDGHRLMFHVALDGQIFVKEIFAHKNDPGADVLSIVRQYAVPHSFSEEVAREAAALPSSVAEEDMQGRADFRDWPIITIDGSDTKDIDDAISLRTLPGGNFELAVHIADVSHYVQPGSALDKEAYARGTSIYLADRVIPMLPHKLSNGICSLNPKEDRLALSCIMEIDQQGDVLAHRIATSIIHSQRRFTYDEVADILDNPSGDQWSQYFTGMDKLAGILRKKRIARGALEFNFSEAKVIVNEEGFPTDITIRHSNAATTLIEEFMIICNETLAEPYKDGLFVFRSHEAPDSDKMYHLSAYAQNLGYNLPVSEKAMSTKVLQTLLAQIKGTAEEAALGPVILRSMKQARYTAENSGHFGLASAHYCHFTSPIRRYPDLMVHRIIKNGLKKNTKLADLCQHCSKTERLAEELEREVLQLKKVQFMSDKLGQNFEGLVSGLVPWGIFVQLPNTVEGLVPLESLSDDEYVFVEKQMAFFGLRTKKRIRLGDPFSVKLSRADVEERKITFIAT